MKITKGLGITATIGGLLCLLMWCGYFICKSNFGWFIPDETMNLYEFVSVADSYTSTLNALKGCAFWGSVIYVLIIMCSIYFYADVIDDQKAEA